MAPSALHRLADDGKWYDEAQFKEFYPSDFAERHMNAPQALERRKDNNMYRDPEYFFGKYGGDGYAWKKNSKAGWDSAIPEQKLADDGKWYTLTEFQKFYPNDWERRFLAAPSDEEMRYEQGSSMPQNAEFFYRKAGGAGWNINAKPSWDSASKTPQVLRLANDGKWYDRAEFEKFYPGQAEYWNNAAKKGEFRRGNDGLSHDADWFFSLYGGQGKNWSKNHREGWDNAPVMIHAPCAGA